MGRKFGRDVGRDIRYEMRKGDNGSDEDVWESLLVIGFCAVIVIGLALAGLGWLDNEFGWSVRENVVGWFTGLFSGGGDGEGSS